jgi:peroxiredoxin
MTRIHPGTTLAVVLNLAALACTFSGYPLIATALAVIAFFAAIREVAKYTSWYQFTVVFVSAIIAGLVVDFPLNSFPFLTAALKLIGLTAVIRIAFFRFFSYTGYSWFEPTMVVLSFVFFFAGILSKQYYWPVFVITAPILLFGVFFSWGTVKDKNQLLKNSRGGYRVQIGKEANDFDLPDQDGKPVKLSDFKGKRHVLLIFVRGDWCPGCHMMLRTYEKNNEKFMSKNVLVMAIGPDPVGVNRGMVEKLGLDFKVLSDEGQKTAMMYGVQLKDYESMVAEKYEEGIPLPASFLIDKQGIVRYVSRPDKVGEFLNPSLIFPIVEQLA